jgi:hypothetical protein
MFDKTQPLDGEDLINYTDVMERIAYLEAMDCHEPEREIPCENRYDCPSCNDEGQELEDLRTLAADMKAANEASGRASALRDSYLKTYIQQEANDIVGDLGHLETYVKWDELTADRADEMEEVTFRGTTYYITP